MEANDGLAVSKLLESYTGNLIAESHFFSDLPFPRYYGAIPWDDAYSAILEMKSDFLS